MLNPAKIPHGAVTPGDWEAMCRSLERVMLTARRLLVTKQAPWFIEVGTLSARTTEGILHALKQLRVLAHVLTIDKAKGAQTAFGARLGGWRGYPTVSFALGKTREAMEGFRGMVAWAFIDGCHCAGCVAEDIRAIAPHVVEGGEIVFHDADPRNRQLGMKVHKRYHGDGYTRLYGVNRAIDMSEEMEGFEWVETIAAIARPQPAPTPIFGGVMVYRRVRS